MSTPSGSKWKQSTRKGSLGGLRSEYNDSTLRTNNQAGNRLLLKQKEYEKAKAQIFSELNHQKKVLLKSSSVRRYSTPAMNYTEMKIQLDSEKDSLDERLKSFMNDSRGEEVKQEGQPGGEKVDAGIGGVISATPGSESLAKTTSPTSSSSPRVSPFLARKEKKATKVKTGSKAASGDVWTTLSVPKQQTVSIRNLRSQLNDSLRIDAHALGPRSRSKPHLSPLMPRKSRGSVDGGYNRGGGGGLLTVPSHGTLQQSHSVEDLVSMPRSRLDLRVPLSHNASPASKSSANTPRSRSPRLGPRASNADKVVTIPDVSQKL